MQCTPRACAWGHLVQLLPNAFGLLLYHDTTECHDTDDDNYYAEGIVIVKVDVQGSGQQLGVQHP